MSLTASERKFTIITFCSVFLICAILAETGIRVYHWTNGRQRFIWLPDPFLAYVHSSDNAFKHHYTEEEKITVEHRTNAFGLLGGDITIHKDKDTFRVLVLGDSFTEALQVPGSKNFCGQLQNYLTALPDKKYKKFEVLNAGVSGYSPLNYYLAYKREWARFRPDLILVQLFANDVFEDNTARAKSVLDENGLPLKTHRYFSEKYWKRPNVAREDFNGEPMGWRPGRFLIDKSRLFEYFYVKFYNMQKASAFHQKMIRLDEFGTGYQFFILDPEHVLSKDEAFRERAWGYTQKYLLALKEEADRHQARLLLFYMPMEVQLTLSHYGRHVSLYIQKQMGTSFNDLLDNFSREHNIRFLDLLNDFESNKSEGLFLNKDGHLTQAGHHVTAKAIFRYITHNGLLTEGGL